MNESIELVVGIPGTQEPIIITLPLQARGLEVVEAVRRHSGSGFGETEEIIIYAGDGEKVLEVDLSLAECGVGHRHPIHAHRCHHIDVAVKYGATDKLHSFAPNATIGQVRHWAAEVFGLAPVTDYRLELDDRVGYLGEEIRLNTLTHDCKLAVEIVHRELTIHYTVDVEDEVSHERYRTAAVILEKAGFKPTDYYLKHKETSYQGRPNIPIRLHEGEVFTAVYVGGGTVS